MIRSRYRQIIFFFARAIVSLIVWDLVLPRLGFGGRVRRTRPARLQRIAAGYRALAVRLGGVLIKVGQFLSARLDVLPIEITAELAGLQDEVPPERFDDIRRVAETDLGGPLSESFASFDPQPLAAASLGQVHRARLKPRPQPEGPTAQPAPAPQAGPSPDSPRPVEGDARRDGGLEGSGVASSVDTRYAGGPDGLDHVVVKIQRPNVEALIATDLAALRTVGRWVQRYPPVRRRADIPALLAEFTRILHEEIDYLHEGRCAETFAANFQGDASVCVPRVAWTHTTRRVLTLEDVYAIKITDYAAITAAGIRRGEVAERLFNTYLRQIFEQHFFHADPHPGNLFVQPGRGRGDPPWQLVFVDFGMSGRVPPGLRAGLREMLIAVGTRDAQRLVRAFQQLGVLLPGADLALLERAEAKMFEHFWGKSMDELRQTSFQEMHAIASEFRQLLYQLPFQLPEDLILLGRTVAILSGLCTGLDPQFNVWAGLAPYAKRMVAEETGNLEFWLKEAGQWLRTALAVPGKLEAVLSRIERGELQVRDPLVVKAATGVERALRQLAAAITLTALLLGGIQLDIAGQRPAAIALLAGAVLALLWLLLALRRG